MYLSPSQISLVRETDGITSIRLFQGDTFVGEYSNPDGKAERYLSTVAFFLLNAYSSDIPEDGNVTAILQDQNARRGLATKLLNTLVFDKNMSVVLTGETYVIEIPRVTRPEDGESNPN